MSTRETKQGCVIAFVIIIVTVLEFFASVALVYFNAMDFINGTASFWSAIGFALGAFWFVLIVITVAKRTLKGK